MERGSALTIVTGDTHAFVRILDERHDVIAEVAIELGTAADYVAQVAKQISARLAGVPHGVRIQ